MTTLTAKSDLPTLTRDNITLQSHNKHGESSLEMFRCFKSRRRSIAVSIIMVSGFVFFTLYTLSLSCCAVPVNSGFEGAEEEANFLIGTADEEVRFQRDTVDEYNYPKYNRLIHKKLLDHREEDTDLPVSNTIYSESIYDTDLGDTEEDSNGFGSKNKSPKHGKDKSDGDYSSKHEGYHIKKGILKTQENGTRKIPQAIIIGVKKGGTRALLEFIRIHPDVRAPGPEPHFFDRHYERGLEWYREQMPPTIKGQITIEKTPSYFVTKGVPRKIYNMSKNMKLIVVLRDPVTRAISDYTQTVTKRPDMKSFKEMAFINNSAGLVDTSWGAIKIGVYAKHLEKWLKYFPLSQIHFVNGEKLITNPAGEMAKFENFLGLKHVISDKHFYFNTTKGFPCLKKTESSGNPHCLGKTKGRTHPKVDEKVITRLQDFYRPFNAKFYQMTGIDFGWP